jgi:starch-binding outer membrane protein, SusD/RagB family
MKIINLKYCVIILFLAMTACNKELDLYPLDQITSENYWKTTNDLKLYVNQFYPNAFSPSGSDQLQSVFATDLPTDDLTYVQADETLRGSRSVPATGGWDYTNIRSLNVFFANYTSCKSSFEEYKRYLGEAYFFRAFYYFNNVKTYGDVPFISKPMETNSKELFEARMPRNQVVDSIIVDLDKAIEYIPSGKQEGGTRLSKEIVQLFKSRVCLYEGTWEKYHTGDVFGVSNPNPQKYLELAVQAANDVMQSGLYTIYSKGNPKWNYFFFAQVDYSTNPEVLFWKKYDVALGIGNAIEFQTATGKGGGVGITKSFVESYLCSDGKPIYLRDGSRNPLYQGDGDLKTTSINRDPRFIQTIFTPGFPLQIVGSDTTFFVRPSVNDPAHTVCPTGYQLDKILNFDPIHHASLETMGVGFTGWIFFRYAEVLLNYAEAKAELGTLTQEDVDKSIKLLRDRVSMPNLNILNIETDPNWLFPSLSPVINEIRRERRVELVLEGFRWDDIARWAAADEVIVGKRPLGGLFNAIDYSDLSAANFSLTNGYFDPLKNQLPNGYGFDLGRDYLSPISTQELNLNKNIVQNPGW